MMNETMNGATLAHYGGAMMDGGYAGMGHGMWGYSGHGLFSILIAIMAIVAVVALVRWLMHGSRHCHANDALDTLAQRFAKGEIDSEEYQGKRKILKSRH